MISNNTKKRSRPVLLTTIAVALILSIAIACNIDSSKEAVSHQAIVATMTYQVNLTNIPVRTGTPGWVLTREAFDTAVAESENHLKTEVAPTRQARHMTETVVALTPESLRPSVTPAPVQPTPTPFLGIMTGCCADRGYPWHTTGGWIGWVNGSLMSVVTGSNWHNAQGIVLVFNGDSPMSPAIVQPIGVYSTPLQIGAIHVVSVDGTRLTLAQINPPYPKGTPPSDVTFVFDIATRQFVTP